jgi:hypothetical protein
MRAWIDQLQLTNISHAESNLLQSNHIDGSIQERLLQANGGSLLLEIAVSIHVVLQVKKTRVSPPSNADRVAFDKEDAASCSGTRVRDSLVHAGNHPAQDATGPEEDGAPTLTLSDGTEDAPSSDLARDDDQSVASFDLANSEDTAEQMKSGLEYDADVEDNDADLQYKAVG